MKAATLPSTRDRLVLESVRLFVEKGYAATSVDEICAAAGATKGAFFHHFSNKEEIGLESIDRYAGARFTAMKEGSETWPADPVERLYVLIDRLEEIAATRIGSRGCLLAIMAMELGIVNERFRLKCAEYLSSWAAYFNETCEAAFRARGARASGAEIAAYFVTLFEGSVVMARAHNDATVYARNFALFRRHVEMMLNV
jgi:TetR/AcrR family transcriptional repressor of nem operon